MKTHGPPVILVVDDDRSQRQTLGDILTDQGFKTLTAASEEEAQEKAQTNHFGVALIDLKLGKGSGLAVLEKVKQLQPETECILITAHASKESAIKALNLGAFSYLEKPITRGQLTHIVQRALEKINTERQLRELKTFHRDILHGMAEGVAVRDEKGRIIYLNPAARRLLGYEDGDLLGKHWTTVIPKSHHHIARETNERRVRGESHRYQIDMERKDGERLRVEINGTPRYENGEYVGSLAVITDITDKARAEQKVRLQSAALQATANAIMITDRRGVIQWVNPAFTDLTGYSAGEAIGRNPRILKSGHQDPEFYTQLWQTIRDGNTWRGRLINRKKGGTEYIDEQTITPVKDQRERITHYVAVKQDVSNQVKAKHALLQQLEELKVLNSLAVAMTEERDRDELISHAVEILSDRLYPDHVEILLLDESKQKLVTHPSYRGLEIEDSQREIPVGDGIVGRVAQDGKPRRVADVNQVEDYIEVDPHMRSELCVPIKTGGKVMGVINVEDSDVNAFSRADLRLLTTFAGQLATALGRLRLFEKTVGQAKKLAGLYRSALVISRELDPELMMFHVSREVEKLFDTDAFLLAEVGQDSREITISMAFEKGERLSDVEEMKLSVDDKEGLISWVIRETSSLLVGDMQNETLPVKPRQAGKMYRSWMGVPMVVGKKQVGALSVQGFRPYAFDQGDQQILELLANLVGVSLENARLFTSTNKQASHLSLVNEIARKALQKLGPGDLLQKAANSLQEMFNYSDVMIFLVDREKSRMMRYAWAGIYHRDVENDVNRALNGQGVLDWVVTRGEPFVSNDVSQEERYLEIIPETKSELCIPLKEGNEVIGGINVESNRRNAFDETDVIALETLADSLVAGLQTARLFGEVRNRVEQIKALWNIERTISSSLDISLMLDVLLREVRSQLEVDAADVLLYDRELQKLEYAASDGFKTRSAEGLTLRVGEGYGGRAVMERKLVHYPDLADLDPSVTRPLSFVGIEGFRGYAAMPLIAKGKVEGVLEVYHRNPLNPEPEWFDFLKTLSTQAAVAIDHATLFEELQRSNVELTQSYEKMLKSWARALELRDQETQGHSDRVTKLALNLAQRMGVSAEERRHIKWGSLLHDVGKMGIPDHILQKPDELSAEEWKMMRRHPEFAHELLSTMDYLKPALDIPYCHHEKWDGTGYPRGLKGEDIPLAARIFAVADVWDALRSDRPYREAWTDERALAYIKSESGKHFDPQVVEVFLEEISQSRSNDF